MSWRLMWGSRHRRLEERSDGDREDTELGPLTHYPLIEPSDERSKHKGYWAGTIAGLLRAGWRMGYTDGTVAGGMAALAVYSEDWRGRAEMKYGAFLGRLAAVLDAERKAVALRVGKETADMLFLLTDSQSALRTAINLSRGHPPGSGEEVLLKQALHRRRDQDTAIT